jgi:hypothetical protein
MDAVLRRQHMAVGLGVGVLVERAHFQDTGNDVS